MDIQELKRLADAATPGPWIAGSADECGYGWVNAPSGGCCTFGNPVQILKAQYRRQGADARFIAAVNPAAVLELIARITELEALNETRLGEIRTTLMLLADARRESAEAQDSMSLAYGYLWCFASDNVVLNRARESLKSLLTVDQRKAGIEAAKTERPSMFVEGISSTQASSILSIGDPTLRDESIQAATPQDYSSALASAIEQAVAPYREDAERYRYLCSHEADVELYLTTPPEELDAAIDAARKGGA